jgi:inward rectifier potassium channel
MAKVGRPLRFLDNRGRPVLVALNMPRPTWRDLYQRALSASWTAFFGWASLYYFTIHLLFAALYELDDNAITNAPNGDYLDAYFFSVQTMMTIGYGSMAPATTWANVLVTIEAFFGMFTTAILTGLVFARFARPTANVLFSNVVCIATHEGKPTLMMRCANARGNRIVEACMSVTLALTVRTKEGHTFRKIKEVPLVRSKNSMFFVSWTAMHVIDEESPLRGETHASLDTQAAELLVVLTGIDEDLGATVHARQAYGAEDIRFDHRFVDVISLTPGSHGLREIDYGKFHDTVPLPKPDPEPVT